MRTIQTLCLIIKDSKILLGMKKRGFGVGRYNGFGGKLNPGEDIVVAARREIEEECGVSAVGLEKRAIIDFYFGNNDIAEVHVFLCEEFCGEPKETEEMRPKWFRLSSVPYEKMWDDDKYWLPLFLKNKKIKAEFRFDKNDKVVDKKVEIVEEI